MWPTCHYYYTTYHWINWSIEDSLFTVDYWIVLFSTYVSIALLMFVEVKKSQSFFLCFYFTRFCSFFSLSFFKCAVLPTFFLFFSFIASIHHFHLVTKERRRRKKKKTTNIWYVFYIFIILSRYDLVKEIRRIRIK